MIYNIIIFNRKEKSTVVKFTLYQLLSLVDNDVDFQSWETFERLAQQYGVLDYLNKEYHGLLQNDISTPLEFEKVNQAIHEISNTYSSFEDMRRKYPIRNNNLLLIIAAVIDTAN